MNLEKSYLEVLILLNDFNNYEELQSTSKARQLVALHKVLIEKTTDDTEKRLMYFLDNLVGYDCITANFAELHPFDQLKESAIEQLKKIALEVWPVIDHKAIA